MQLRFYATIWAIGVLVVGCESQSEQYSATLSLQSRAEERAQAIYDQVELIAGSGAEEDEQAADDEAEEMVPEETSSPDGGLEALREATRFADDSPLCGNGELDLGELCDPFIIEGDGVCPNHCDPAPGCPAEELVVHGCGTRCMPVEEPSEECLQGQ